MHKVKLIINALFILSIVGCANSQLKTSSNEYDYFLADSKTLALDDNKENSTSVDYFLLGKKAQAENEEDKALYYYVKTIEKNSNNAIALILVGDIHSKRGNRKIGYKAYELALAASPDNVEAKEKLGLSLLNDSQYGDAEKYLSEVVKQDVNRSESWNGLGVIEDVNGNFAKAKEYYAAALKVNPNAPDIINNFAFSLYLDGDWVNAEKYYLKLLNIDSQHKQGNLNYGLLLARLGKPKKALDHVEKVLPKAAALNEIGYIYYLEKRYYEAAQLFEMAIDASPTYFDKAYENLNMVRSHQTDIPITNSLLNSVIHEKQVAPAFDSQKSGIESNK